MARRAFKLVRNGSGLLLLVLLTACSNQQVYEAIQSNRIQECDKYPSETARQDCRDRYEASYEEYEEARTQDVSN